jgi:tRNA threonylcarbamoyladenosine biosynthesis protein TsaE
MNNKDIYLTKHSEETRKLGIDFAKKIKYGDFLAFYGNLGSGKTTFIQGLAEGLGIKRRIISPTFIILRHYKLDRGSFYHVDLYRTNSKHDLLGLGMDEIIEDKNNIIAVEWSDKLNDFLPKKRIELHFKYIEENEREIIIKKYE